MRPFEWLWAYSPSISVLQLSADMDGCQNCLPFFGRRLGSCDYLQFRRVFVRVVIRASPDLADEPHLDRALRSEPRRGGAKLCLVGRIPGNIHSMGLGVRLLAAGQLLRR